jgi:regulatory protein
VTRPPPDAVDQALRALRTRDLSARDLARKLEARGFDSVARARALESLERTGLIDDERFARNRAASLSSRGAGNALIRHELRRAGVAEDLVETLVDELDPEEDRARAVVLRRGAGAKTARYLRGKGFADDVVAAVASDDRSGLG